MPTTPNLDAYYALQRVSDDHESDTLEQLAVKAGLLWKCADQNGFVDRPFCGWMNALDDTTCGGCGLARGHEGAG